MNRPAVILLHGASGVGSGWLIYPYAEEIARHGIDAFVIHYFDGLDPSIGNRSGTRNFAARNGIILDAIRHVRSLPETDADRIGLFGLSLGGFHAVDIAARDPGLGAVVALMGALPRSTPEAAVRSMPPTLILHGARDAVVPIDRAVDLALLLGRLRSPFDMKIYVHGGHTMAGDAHGNSVRLVAEFFRRHLTDLGGQGR